MTVRSCTEVLLTMLLLAFAGICSAFGQSTTGSSLKIVVETSSGRVYQQKAPAAWNSIYAGRSLRIDQTFVVSNDASMRLAVGALRVDVLPITIAAVTEVDGSAENPRLRLRLEAGAVRVIQPARSTEMTKIDCVFGSVAAADSEFLIDGNRLSVERGEASVTNGSGNRRTVLAGEQLIVSPSGFLPLPTRAR